MGKFVGGLTIRKALAASASENSLNQGKLPTASHANKPPTVKPTAFILSPSIPRTDRFGLSIGTAAHFGLEFACCRGFH